MEIVIRPKCQKYISKLPEKQRKRVIEAIWGLKDAEELKKKACALIDYLSVRQLLALLPLLQEMTQEKWQEALIETDLTKEEERSLEKCKKEFAKHPEHFISFSLS